MSHLPPGWVERESKSHPGQIYYFNSSTGESSWHPPQERVFHILRKHSGSRRPSSWRNNQITQSINEARAQVSGYRDELQRILQQQGYDEMLKRFREIATTDSDCGSHGQMQKPFENASSWQGEATRQRGE
eukprot:gene3959-4330_t